MDHLKVPAKLGIFILEIVITVGQVVRIFLTLYRSKVSRFFCTSME